MPENSLRCGDTVLVTGASRGIGRAIALGLGRAGFQTAVNYRQSRSEADDVVNQIREAGGTAHAFGADVSDPAEAASLVDRVEA
ncbi:MAG: hypothetical protein NVSMB52_19390 [Chloroflexota bacterium]